MDDFYRACRRLEGVEKSVEKSEGVPGESVWRNLEVGWVAQDFLHFPDSIGEGGEGGLFR
jgi:hypothetical protein